GTFTFFSFLAIKALSATLPFHSKPHGFSLLSVLKVSRITSPRIPPTPQPTAATYSTVGSPLPPQSVRVSPPRCLHVARVHASSPPFVPVAGGFGACAGVFHIRNTIVNHLSWASASRYAV